MLNSNSASASNSGHYQERRVMVWSGAEQLEGTLSIPPHAHALVVFAYNRMGDSQRLLGNLDALAEAHRQAGLATLSVSLLTPEDEALDNATGFFRQNVGVLHQRISGITNWLIADDEVRSFNIGYFCVGASAAAALAAAATRPDAIHAVIAVDPPINTVRSYLPRLVARTLFITGERNTQEQDTINKALAEIASETTLDIVREARKRGLAYTLEVIPDVANVFENEQSLQKVEQLAVWWFTSYL
jgi:putative phosphoribosyl transferase